jgi:bifunctional non-homologous end joining protein LigD
MLATAGNLALLGDQAAWGFEMKWDGVRALVHVHAGRARLVSRNAVDMSRSYPEITAVAGALAGRCAVLDGEIVALDAAGRPSFARLQKRMHIAEVRNATRLASSDPAVLLAFDLLHLDSQSLLQQPWTLRRERLESLELAGPAWQTPAVFLGTGTEAVAVSKEQSLEGVVAKRLGSVYTPGRRCPDWVKIKNVRTQEVVIGGWTPGRGRRVGMIGALLLGLPGPTGMIYAGKVGTGFTDAMLRDLAGELGPLATASSPFDQVPRPDAREARWVSPLLVGEVVFTEWTGDGRLRHPTWRGLRPDKSPDQVTPET